MNWAESFVDELTDVELALLEEELAAETRKYDALAAIEQFQINRHIQDFGRKSHDGFGETYMEMSPWLYHRLARKEAGGDYRCWGLEGQDFQKWVQRKHPDVKVESKGAKDIHVGWNADLEEGAKGLLAVGRGNVRETKSYELDESNRG